MFVYWIKRKDMTDPYSEGYVGVTNQTIDDRFKQHSKNVYRKSIVKKAIDKYDDISIIELHNASESECLQFELMYRPTDNIGWNMTIGGGKPPRVTTKTAEKISKTHKKRGTNPYSENTHSPAAIAKRKLAMVGRKWFHNPNNPNQRTLANVCPTGWEEGIKPKKKKCIRGVDYICNVSSWRLTSPQGDQHEVYNLKEWCKQKGLPYLGPHRGKTWRGWYIEKITS